MADPPCDDDDDKPMHDTDYDSPEPVPVHSPDVVRYGTVGGKVE